MTVEEQAVVLVNEVRAEREQEIWKGVGDRRGYGIVLEALCRAIERHEAFKQEVSDALLIYSPENRNPALGRFIIAKPDPLVDIVEWLGGEWTPEEYAKEIRAALDARGLEIREKGQ